MSDAPGRKLLLLSVRFLVLFALLSGLWLAAGRYYARVLAATARAITPLVESPRLTIEVAELSQLEPDMIKTLQKDDPSVGAGDLVFQFGLASGSVFTLRGDLHFNLVFLISLIWSTLTNVPPKRRLAMIGISLALLFAYHVVQVEIYVQNLYAFGRVGNALDLLFTDGQRAFLYQAGSFAKLGERGFPVLIWLVLFVATRPRADSRVEATSSAPPSEPAPGPGFESSR